MRVGATLHAETARMRIFEFECFEDFTMANFYLGWHANGGGSCTRFLVPNA